jgi:hypothetical protein
MDEHIVELARSIGEIAGQDDNVTQMLRKLRLAHPDARPGDLRLAAFFALTDPSRASDRTIVRISDMARLIH